VAAIHFVATERGEPGYAASKLWSTGEWRRHVIAGAAQAFTTRIPTISWSTPIPEVIEALPPGSCRVTLDNYEATAPLSSLEASLPFILAIGSERGWSAAERDFLRHEGFTLAHMGERVLRTETAAVAALAIARSMLGLM
jgi:RsmE family RNA methyltransferase